MQKLIPVSAAILAGISISYGIKKFYDWLYARDIKKINKLYEYIEQKNNYYTILANNLPNNLPNNIPKCSPSCSQNEVKSECKKYEEYINNMNRNESETFEKYISNINRNKSEKFEEYFSNVNELGGVGSTKPIGSTFGIGCIRERKNNECSCKYCTTCLCSYCIYGIPENLLNGLDPKICLLECQKSGYSHTDCKICEYKKEANIHIPSVI